MQSEWFFKHNNAKGVKEDIIDGIYYPFTHKDSDFNFPAEKSENIALPVKDPMSKGDALSATNELFRSEPLEKQRDRASEENL